MIKREYDERDFDPTNEEVDSNIAASVVILILGIAIHDFSSFKMWFYHLNTTELNNCWCKSNDEESFGIIEAFLTA